MTMFQHLKQDWQIKRQDLKDAGLNPDKDWEKTTVEDLGIIADLLDVNVSDLFE